ncbi:hypothetical protein [Saccharothrix sp. NRRL B-16314]|uniref:hypothetical protein n=1 Tax=Saccharothrix sp. NRRL B-16314 TaxID=1463825 RepID=UPI000526338B|nr:hypothetical protein [Saccharothrix sp. NRRL B-16314]
MGMYVAVRGWIEFDHGQRPLVEEIVSGHGDGYAGGWAFPAAPFNWTAYVFFGGDIREAAVASLRDRVAELARLDPVDDDLDMPAGFFLLSDERQRSVAWTVRDGRVVETPAPAELRWFARRP